MDLTLKTNYNARKHVRRNSQQKLMIGFSMTVLLGYMLLFQLFPMVYSLVGSFFNWKPLQGAFAFNGLANYEYVFSDSLFWTSLWNTLFFALVTCALYIGLGLIFATLIFMVPKGRGYFRTTFFLPVITSGVAVSLLWKYAFYNTNNGLFNTILGFFGVNPQMWLLDEHMVIPCIIFMTVWKELGYAVIIFYAGLNEIPAAQFEAATIDGASKFQIFKKIIIPSIKPTTLLVAVTGMIKFMQVFDQVMLMTSSAGSPPGGPGTSSYTSMLLIYDYGFGDFNFGRASAVGYALVLVIMVFTVIQFRLNRAEDAG